MDSDPWAPLAEQDRSIPVPVHPDEPVGRKGDSYEPGISSDKLKK